MAILVVPKLYLPDTRLLKFSGESLRQTAPQKNPALRNVLGEVLPRILKPPDQALFLHLAFSISRTLGAEIEPDRVASGFAEALRRARFARRDSSAARSA